jgi:phage-related minor tail protein
MNWFRDLPLGLKLAFVGLALCAFAIVGMQSLSRTFAPIAGHAQAEAQAHRLSSAAAEGFEQWTLDDDQSNMYAALIALRHNPGDELTRTTLRQALAARKAVDPQLDALDRLSADPQLRALLTEIRHELTSYDAFTEKMITQANAGQVDAMITTVAIDNSDVSDRLTRNFRSAKVRADDLAQSANSRINGIAELGRERQLEISAIMVCLTVLLMTVFGETSTS